MIQPALLFLVFLGLLVCGCVVALVPTIRKAMIQSQRSTPPSNQDFLNVICQQHDITPREQEVIRLIMGGYRNKQISEELLVSASTIKKHITKIYHKLNITSRSELMTLVNSPASPSDTSSRDLSVCDDK
jgi:DNA-binding NarL/FixJ family response regulator